MVFTRRASLAPSGTRPPGASQLHGRLARRGPSGRLVRHRHGLIGVVLHLDSRFFHERTIKSLVYAAPFAAPLAYTGLGLLLVMNRMVDRKSEEWPRWVLLLGLGGVAGNFVFSLTDHAQNGFFYWTEWIPVVSSAFATGFLVTIFITPVTRRFLWLCAVVLAMQAAVGLLGFVLHTSANLHRPSPDTFGRFVFGAPALAPMLFPNLTLLCWLGLWVLGSQLPEGNPSATPSTLREVLSDAR